MPTDEKHGLATLRKELSYEQERLYAFAEDVSYHDRMLTLKRKERKETQQRVADLEEAIQALEGTVNAGTQSP